MLARQECFRVPGKFHLHPGILIHQVWDGLHPSIMAASSTSTSSQETTGMETSSMETEGDGIIDGLMNDVEKGANDVKDGVDDITGESNTVNESGTNNTTEAR